MKKRYGWTEKGIVGFVFAPLGFVFLVIGLLVSHTVDAVERLAFEICFVGLGAVFLLTGAVLLFMEFQRRRREREAYESGNYVMAKIVGIKANYSINMMGTHPVKVECHYTDPDSGTVHVYYSRNLYIEVGDLLTSDEVPVYIDRNGTGFVDIDAVLPVIEVHR